jgi:sugar diacid utilization regulator
MATLSREDARPPTVGIAVSVIAARLDARRDEIADRVVARIRQEIPDYRLVDDDVIADVRSITFAQLVLLLDTLRSGVEPEEADFVTLRDGGARRVHQGISLESFQRAARLWGHVLWEAVLVESDQCDAAEREAALEIAGRVMRHVDEMSRHVADAFLNELQSVWSDREVVRRDLLDGLVSGQGDTERIRRLARTLKLSLAGRYIVVVLRGPEALAEEQADQALAARVALRRVMDLSRRHLRTGSCSALVGMRHGEVVALCPAEQPDAVADVRGRVEALAAALASADVCVGVGDCHALTGIASSYSEAREAAEIAVGIGVRGRPVFFDEVLIDHMVRSTPHAERILDSTLRPLLDYDAAKNAELVPTLRAYVSSGFNLTRSAEVLNVHPNTVVYRLRRLRELSGRDPQDPDDLLLLFLGLKLVDLRAR